MNRSQFLGAILAPVALLFRRKEEPKPVIKNSRFKELKKIQARLDFIRKYPLTERESYLPSFQIRRRDGGLTLAVDKRDKETIEFLEWMEKHPRNFFKRTE